MRVKELIEKLQKMPQDAPVGFNGEGRVRLEVAGESTIHSSVDEKVVGVHQVCLCSVPYRSPTTPKARIRSLMCVMLNPTLRQLDDAVRYKTTPRE